MQATTQNDQDDISRILSITYLNVMDILHEIVVGINFVRSLQYCQMIKHILLALKKIFAQVFGGIYFILSFLIYHSFI